MKTKKKTAKKKARKRPAKKSTAKLGAHVNPSNIKIEIIEVIEDSAQRRLVAENRALRHLVYRMNTKFADLRIDAEILRVEAQMREEATVG
jgi:hypothetical protein